MTGVPQSSSHAGFRAVQQDAQPRSFEVGSEAELLGLLNFIRRGPFLPDQKNMLRDVVLDFAVSKEIDVLNIVAKALARNGATLTNNGTPLIEVVKEEPAAPQAPIEEEEKVEQKEVPAEAEPKESVSATPSGFGGARPQPSFGQSALTPSPAPAAPPTPTHAEDIAHKTVSVTSADPEPVPSVAEHTGIQGVTPGPATEPVSKVPEPTPASAVEEKLVDETNPETSVQEVSKQKEVTPAEPAPVASTDPQTRIKEIKMAINAKVGNPVNLIDSNNQVGREYMNALLNAMKSANGGQREEVALAMQRLEKAFAAVEESLSSGEIVIPKKEEQVPTAEHTDTRWKESSVPDATPATPAAPPPVAPTPDPVPQPEPVAPPVTPPAAPEPAVSETPQTPQNKDTQPQMVMVDDVSVDLPPAPVVPAAPTSPTVSVPPTPATPVAPSQPATSVPTQAPQAPQTPPVPQAAPASVPTPPQSLAAKVQAEQAEREAVTQKNVAAIQAEKAATLNDPLHADQVNKGLEQLLSEWKLFKSSGIFGTGPNGYDHPLYKAIAPLPMAAVIAGRFDGVNPEIRQSISDYMSGWRYEQGVVHEMNESFEHYLRRVIHKILEKQSTGQ